MATRSTVISWLSKADESFLGTEGSDWWRSPIARIVIQYQPKRVILLSRNPEFASEVRHELHPKIKELASETEWLPVQYFPSQGISDEHNPARACRDIQAVVAKWKLNGDPYLIFNVIGGSAAMGQSAYWISSQLPGSPVLVMAPPIDRLPSDLTNLYVQEVEPLPSMTVSRAGTSPTTDDIPILDLGLPPDLARQVALLAKSQEPILILGEPGTGKSHLARAIHRLSCFSGAFVDLNCGTLSDRDRTRSELFGHVQGA